MSRELIAALDSFIQNFYHGESLTDAQSKRNLEEGVIELVWRNGQHAGNGFLITENGYFLTARHCLEGSLSNLLLRTPNRKIYSIQGMEEGGEKTDDIRDDIDVAVGKAVMPGSCVPKIYRFINQNAVEENMPLELFTRREGIICKKKGFVRGDYLPTHFGSDISAEAGDSGGIVVDYRARIVGILYSYNKLGGISWIIPYGNAVKLFKALEIVHLYKRKLESSL